MDLVMEDDFDAEDLLDNWIYLEEDVFLADDLAETQIPDPGYAGTAFEMMMDDYDYEELSYWDDVEYGNDEYWDGPIKFENGSREQQPRTRGVKQGHKRRKSTLKDTTGDNVRFLSISGRIQKWMEARPVSENRTAFALLPDWRVRLEHAGGVARNTEMPQDMSEAAKGVADNSSSPPTQPRVNDPLEGNGEGWGDEDADDMLSEMASLDPETLQAVLKEKLGAAGLQGMDESAFVQSITQMLSGGRGADEAVNELANSLLGRAAEGNDIALSAWLSQQGVSLDDEDDRDDENANDANVVHSASNRGSHGPLRQARANHDASPQDSVLDSANGTDFANLDIANHRPSPTTNMKKRAASQTTTASAAKRKRVMFDVPGSAVPTQLSNDESAEGLHADIKHQARATVSDQKNSAVDSVSADLSEDTQVKDVATLSAVKTTRRRYNDATASSMSKSKSAKQLHEGVTQSTSIKGADTKTKPAVPAPARASRKRKAESVADAGESAAPLQKRHASTTPRAVSEPDSTVNRPRSGRAAAKGGK